ncbi:hypothetical protein EVA_12477 [gut metagenome]|uniref:Uncharacterized protein n=1 Tax=gut metagenome TaxID=749906 RepID=J9GCA2_9ZZZZ
MPSFTWFAALRVLTLFMWKATWIPSATLKPSIPN